VNRFVRVSGETAVGPPGGTRNERAYLNGRQVESYPTFWLIPVEEHAGVIEIAAAFFLIAVLET